MTYRTLLDSLKALPEDRRQHLVVRSMPFGDIIEDDTRKVHGHVKPAAERQRLAYGLCRAAKGDALAEGDIEEWLR